MCVCVCVCVCMCVVNGMIKGDFSQLNNLKPRFCGAVDPARI